MKAIIKSLLKKKVMSFLIIIEITISILYLISVMVAIQQAFQTNILVPKLIDCDTEKLLEIEIGEDAISFEKSAKIREDLIKDENIKSFAAFNDKWRTISDNNSKPTLVLEISEDSLNVKKFNVSEGRMLVKEDFKSDTCVVSVLIWEKLAKKENYNLLDEIETEEENEENEKIIYKIVGILEENSAFPCHSISDSDGVVGDLDEAIVCPVTKNILKYSYSERLYCIFENGNNIQYVTKLIENEMKKNDYNVAVYSVDDKLNDILKEKIAKNMNWLVLAIIIVILNAVCVTTIICSLIYTRKYEIGVRISVGYSIKQIKKLFIGEIVAIAVISYIVAYIFTKCMYSSNLDDGMYLMGNYVSGQILTISGIALLLFCVPPVIAILYKFNKMQPKDMIGGRE